MRKYWFLIVLLILFSAKAFAFRIPRPPTFSLPLTQDQINQLNDTLENIWNLQLGEFNLDQETTSKTNAGNGDFWILDTGLNAKIEWKSGGKFYTAGTAGVTFFGGHAFPINDDTYDLGAPTTRWRSLYVGPGTIHLGSQGAESLISYDNANSRVDVSGSMNVNGNLSTLTFGIDSFTDCAIMTTDEDANWSCEAEIDMTTLGNYRSLDISTDLLDETGTGQVVFNNSPTMTSITVNTSITHGATQWNTSDNIDGEVIADDTIDDDSIDFGTGTDQIDIADLPDFTVTDFQSKLIGETGTGVAVYNDSPTMTSITVNTSITHGSTQWNTSDNIDGEVIADDTIDEDSIDWGTGTDQVEISDFPDFTVTDFQNKVIGETGTGVLVYNSSATMTSLTVDTSLTMGAASLNEAELEILDGATITTAELETLSDGSDADALHVHSGASLNDDIFLLNSGDITTGDITFNDNINATFGTGGDADIDYDGTNLNIDPQVVGSGGVDINGKIAIGTASLNSLYMLHGTESVAANSGDYRPINVNGTLDAASATSTSAFLRGYFSNMQTGSTATAFTGQLIGMQFLTNHQQAVNLATMQGVLGQAIVGPVIGVSGTATATTMKGAAYQVQISSGNTGTVLSTGVGLQSFLIMKGPGTVTSAYGFESTALLQDGGSGAGTITNLSLFRGDFSTFNAGTVTTGIGLQLIAFPSGPTYTNGPYGISQEGVGDINWFAGDVQIGQSSRPTSVLGKLAVNGDADEIQVLFQGHTTQETNIFVIEDSSGTDIMTVSTTGIQIDQDLTVSAMLAVTPQATAPTLCDIGDIYVDTSGAYCACTSTDTWENMTATGTCS